MAATRCFDVLLDSLIDEHGGRERRTSTNYESRERRTSTNYKSRERPTPSCSNLDQEITYVVVDFVTLVSLSCKLQYENAAVN